DAVLAAGDTLIITYTGRDVRTNEVLPPAVPVNELLDVIDSTVATNDGRTPRDHVVQHHPLQPADPRCFQEHELGHSRPWSFDPGMLAAAQAAAGPRLTAGPFLRKPLAPVADDIVTVDDLVGFVQHPVRAFLRQRLELSLRTSDDRPADALSV